MWPTITFGVSISFAKEQHGANNRIGPVFVCAQVRMLVAHLGNATHLVSIPPVQNAPFLFLLVVISPPIQNTAFRSLPLVIALRYISSQSKRVTCDGTHTGIGPAVWLCAGQGCVAAGQRIQRD